jgi:hypothetical protein
MNELINEVTNEWVNDIYWICCCYKLQLRCRTFHSLVFFSGFYLYLYSLHFLYCTILFIYFAITSNFPLFTACFLIVFPANLFYLSLYFSSIFYTSLVLLEAIFIIQIYWSIFITFSNNLSLRFFVPIHRRMWLHPSYFLHAGQIPWSVFPLIRSLQTKKQPNILRYKFWKIWIIKGRCTELTKLQLVFLYLLLCRANSPRLYAHSFFGITVTITEVVSFRITGVYKTEKWIYG